MAKGVTKKKAKKSKLSAADKALAKIQTDHRSSVRGIFTGAGFARMTGIADKQFTFDNQSADVDDIFVYENVVIIAEYTCRQTDGIGDHLKAKKIIFDKILNDPSVFIEFISTKFPDTKAQFSGVYHKSKIVLKIIYCSRYEFDEHYKINVPGPAYFDYPSVRYFMALIDSIKRSARWELLHFLEIPNANVGSSGVVGNAEGSQNRKGLVLPEAHSNFDDGYKVVSFYTDADALLRTAYVLRKDGWRDSLNLYQRMISKAKIEAIRNYLRRQKRVFINNIVVTLPSDVQPLDANKKTVDPSTLTDIEPVMIKLPDRANSIGVVDGQHRIFAYHETSNDDPEIAQLRKQQNLLVTGIIFPEGVTSVDREKFEARLFLEINSNQTNAKSDLKQAIGLVLEPFSAESIAARVLNRLAKTGPLSGQIQQYFFDTNKLKTASIVSYGLKPLVKTTGTDSLFSIWTNPNKASVADGNDTNALEAYIAFCVATINLVLSAIRRNLTKERWTTETKVSGRVLSTVYVNSFLITTRLLIEKKVALTEDKLVTAFVGIDGFNFNEYHSSQYARMAEKIVETHFRI
jgi:DGQHR domain-containing protein